MQDIFNPYRKICRYRFCQKPFTADRLNQEYCCDKHKQDENNWKARLDRIRMKDQTARQKKCEKMLESIFRCERFIVKRKELEDIDFDFTANCSTLKEKTIRGTIITKMYFDFGLQGIDENTFRIISKYNSTIKPLDE